MRKQRENERTKASMRSEGKRNEKPLSEHRERAGSKAGSRTAAPSGARQSAALAEVHLQGPERW